MIKHIVIPSIYLRRQWPLTGLASDHVSEAGLGLLLLRWVVFDPFRRTRRPAPRRPWPPGALLGRL